MTRQITLGLSAVLLAFLISTSAGCGHDGDVWFVLPEELPSCIVDIAFLNTEEPLGYIPQYIIRYEYNGAEVFYLYPDCTDCLFGDVLDAECNYLCSPEFGQVVCGDFYKDATDRQLIWCRTRDYCRYAEHYY